MRFLVDECVGPTVARWLRDAGNDVVSVYDDARGTSDVSILAQACAQDRIIVTGDRDFGTMVFRERRAHRGVVLLRLDDDRPLAKIAVLRRLLEAHAADIPGAFVVVTATQVRIARPR